MNLTRWPERESSKSNYLVAQTEFQWKINKKILIESRKIKKISKIT